MILAKMENSKEGIHDLSQSNRRSGNNGKKRGNNLERRLQLPEFTKKMFSLCVFYLT